MARLPEKGLKPRWSNQELPGTNGGGWSSPIVAGGKVFLFAHGRAKNAERDLPPLKNPPLEKSKKDELTADQIKEYERVRGVEEAERRRLLRYEERIHCLHGDTGELLWTTSIPSKYTQFPQSGSPAIVDGRLFLLGAGRMVRCLETDAGKVLWNRRLPGEFKEECQHSSVAVTKGVAAVFAGRLFGLDTNSGKLLWESEDAEGRDLHSSPVVWDHNGTSWFIASISGKDTVCVEPRTGEEQWRVTTNTGNATPLVVGTRLITYGSSRKNSVRCFQISSTEAEPEWAYSDISDPGSSPVVLNERVFVQGGKRLACLDLKSGEELWKHELELNDPRYTSLVAGDDKVFYALDGLLAFSATSNGFEALWRGKLDKAGVLADQETLRKQLDADKLESTAEGREQFDKLWRQKFAGGGPLACASPALVNGRLYLRTASGVACYNLRGE